MKTFQVQITETTTLIVDQVAENYRAAEAAVREKFNKVGFEYDEADATNTLSIVAISESNDENKEVDDFTEKETPANA